MIDGNVNDFLEHSTYEEVAVLYKGKKYFFYGLLRDSKTKMYEFTIDTSDKQNRYIETVLEIVDINRDECIRRFLAAPCFEGKTFWEAESEMEWVEC